MTALAMDVRELSVDEIATVSAGLAFLAPVGVAVVRCGASGACRTAVRVGITAAGAAVAGWLGWENNRDDDDD